MKILSSVIVMMFFTTIALGQVSNESEKDQIKNIVIPITLSI